ncbi:MAG: nickel-dependent hydrogenase large subunit [Chloroflexota bacterium]
MTKDIIIPALTRVEGEGALYIRTKDGVVDEIELNIYEPPRFFEGFLQGRYYQEIPDITARICGICPVAYQMSGAKALEQALGVRISPQVRTLRRLFYCAEYIESHALHVYVLQAPDLTGHESVISLAGVAPEIVKQALRLKKIGNALLRAVGGRSIHPVNTCVGGFYRWPDVEKITALLPDLEWALETLLLHVPWAAGLTFPDFEMDYEFVALTHPDEYAIYDGDILSSTGRRVSVNEFEDAYLESHVPHSTALHSHTVDSNPYLVGPLARLNLNYAQLRPIAREAADGMGIELPLNNPYKSFLARIIELIEICDVAIELVKEYDPQGPSCAEITVQAGEGAGVSEAPRGTLYHRYKVDENGFILQARITPPRRRITPASRPTCGKWPRRSFSRCPTKKPVWPASI